VKYVVNNNINRQDIINDLENLKSQNYKYIILYISTTVLIQSIQWWNDNPNIIGLSTDTTILLNNLPNNVINIIPTDTEFIVNLKIWLNNKYNNIYIIKNNYQSQNRSYYQTLYETYINTLTNNYNFSVIDISNINKINDINKFNKTGNIVIPILDNDNLSTYLSYVKSLNIIQFDHLFNYTDLNNDLIIDNEKLNGKIYYLTYYPDIPQQLLNIYNKYGNQNFNPYIYESGYMIQQILDNKEIYGIYGYIYFSDIFKNYRITNQYDILIVNNGKLIPISGYNINNQSNTIMISNNILL
jgi:hypothetical protein